MLCKLQKEKARWLKEKQQYVENEQQYVENEQQYLKENQKLRDMWKVPENIAKLDDVINLDLMHRLEFLENIINDPKMLHTMTGIKPDQFKHVYDLFVKKSQHADAPLFVEDKYADPGNRCKLHRRHVVLLTLIRLKTNIHQAGLGAMFGVDQSTVSRYLKFSINILLESLATTTVKIMQRIQKCTTIKELKKIIPGLILITDATHTRKHRPGDGTSRKGAYSGKKKDFTFNTTIIVNRMGLVLHIGKSCPGSTHDITMLKNELLDFGRWNKLLYDPNTPKNKRFIIYLDLGYLGIQKWLLGATIIIPYKKKPNSGGLTEEESQVNKENSRKRIPVEHTIGRIKQWDIMQGPYDGTAEQLNKEMNLAAAFENLKLLWDPVLKRPNFDKIC